MGFLKVLTLREVGFTDTGDLKYEQGETGHTHNVGRRAMQPMASVTKLLP